MTQVLPVWLRALCSQFFRYRYVTYPLRKVRPLQQSRLLQKVGSCETLSLVGNISVSR